MNKGIVLIVVFLFVIVSFTSISGNQTNNHITKPSFRGDILYVGGSGEGNYSSIQDAIDDAFDGDTVFVYDDSSPYNENIVISKSITLVGECKDTTIIYGYMVEDAINITADWVNISGFTIDFVYDNGIKIYSDHNTIFGNNILKGNMGIVINSNYNSISDNNISNCFYGITNSNSILCNNILDNNISDSVYGLWFDSSEKSAILGNTLYKDVLGIRLDISKDNIINLNNFSGNSNCIQLRRSSENIIKNNSLIDNAHGMMLSHSNNNTIIDNYQYPSVGCTSFSLSYSNNNTIINNTIFHGSDIYLYKSNKNFIYGNTVSKSGNGISLLNSSNNTIVFNNLISSYMFGLFCAPSYEKDYKVNLENKNCNHLYHNNILKSNKKRGDSLYGNDNIIYHNYFINNSDNVYDICNNTWDNGYPSGGNFWSDYNGTDNDGDGIGDTPYSISGGNNEDRYPLGNFVPDIPMINGPTQGKPGVNYNYTFFTIDPEDDHVWYHISWRDNLCWIYGPYLSSEEITLSYNWFEKGTYLITCYARDIYGGVSNVSTLEVTIPRNKAVTDNMLLLRILERFPLLQKIIQLQFGL